MVWKNARRLTTIHQWTDIFGPIVVGQTYSSLLLPEPKRWQEHHRLTKLIRKCVLGFETLGLGNSLGSPALRLTPFIFLLEDISRETNIMIVLNGSRALWMLSLGFPFFLLTYSAWLPLFCFAEYLVLSDGFFENYFLAFQRKVVDLSCSHCSLTLVNTKPHILSESLIIFNPALAWNTGYFWIPITDQLGNTSQY